MRQIQASILRRLFVLAKDLADAEVAFALTD
jgi:hypothetical protein